MRTYTVKLAAVSVSAAKTVIGVHLATLGATASGIIVAVNRVALWQSGSTTSTQARATLGRIITSAGTSTAATPTKSQANDPASIVVAGVNHTGEPTYVSGDKYMDVGFNWLAGFERVFTVEERPTFSFAGATNAIDGMGFRIDTIGATMTVSAELSFSEIG